MTKRQEAGRKVGNLPKDPKIYQSERHKELGRINCYKRYPKWHPEITDPIERFWIKVQRGTPNDCWNWMAGLTIHGYGLAYWCKMGRNAHTVAWEIANGRRPEKGMCICHKCDNPRCCNPNHLFEASPKENTRDAVLKKRMAHGERHGCHILTDHQVVEIRNMHQAGNASHMSISKLFGVSRSTVTLIVNNRIWTHLL